MMRALPILLLLAACAPLPENPVARGEICRDAFRDYDREKRLSPDFLPIRPIPEAPPFQQGSPEFAAESRLLQFDCLLRPDDMPDLAALDRAGLAKPAPLTPAPRQYVHLALVTNNADEAALRGFAESLGYNAGAKGVKRLGRRVYLGPFTSAEEQAAALRLAEALGIRSAYPLSRIP